MISQHLGSSDNVLLAGFAIAGVAILVIATYEFCISSISQQPQIQYRFTLMLLTFNQSLIPLLAIIYLCLDDYSHDYDHNKWRSSVGILAHLIQTTSRFLAICCAHSASLHFLFWAEGRVRVAYLRWTQFASLFLITLDIAQVIVCITWSTTSFQSIYFCILSTVIVFHGIVICFALYGAIGQFDSMLDHVEHSLYDDDRFRIHLSRLYGLLIVIAVTILPVTLSTYFMIKNTVETFFSVHDGNSDGGGQRHFDPIDGSPGGFMHSMDQFVVYRMVSMAFCMVLLWWLHIPKSLCCGGCCSNIASDSLCFSCCTKCCSLFSLSWEPMPSESNDDYSYQRRSGYGRQSTSFGPQYGADFDFFNFENWGEHQVDLMMEEQSTFTITIEDQGPQQLSGPQLQGRGRGRDRYRGRDNTRHHEDTMESSLSMADLDESSIRKRKPKMLSPETITAYNPDYSNTEESGMVVVVPSTDMEQYSVELQALEQSASSDFR